MRTCCFGSFLKALKYARREDLSDRFEVLLADAAELESDDLKLILTYLNDCPIADENRRRLRETLQRVIPGKAEDIMGWITQPEYDRGKSEGFVEGRHEGREEGRSEGRQEGVIEGAVRALTRLLEKRFGTIPLDLRQRILDTDTASIETWIERAVDAPDVRSVFDVKPSARQPG